VSVAEAARILGKSERTIRRWERDGKIPSDRTGPGIRVDIGGLLPDAVGQVLTQADVLQVELERLQERVDDLTAERDFLRDRLLQAEALSLMLAGERRQLTPGRRFRWPWQRGEGG